MMYPVSDTITNQTGNKLCEGCLEESATHKVTFKPGGAIKPTSCLVVAYLCDYCHEEMFENEYET